MSGRDLSHERLALLILRATPTAAGPSAINCGLAIFAGLVGLAIFAGLVGSDFKVILARLGGQNNAIWRIFELI